MGGLLKDALQLYFLFVKIPSDLTRFVQLVRFKVQVIHLRNCLGDLNRVAPQDFGLQFLFLGVVHLNSIIIIAIIIMPCDLSSNYYSIMSRFAFPYH